MNSLLNMFGGGKGNIMMQAFGAMMRGESPKTFMQGLAKNHPQLQGMNFDNLQNAAQEVCNKNGVDMNQKMNEIQSQFPKMS